MKKEYKVELTLDQMDIIIAALKYYPCCCETENNNKLITLGKLMHKESKIYEKESQRS